MTLDSNLLVQARAWETSLSVGESAVHKLWLIVEKAPKGKSRDQAESELNRMRIALAASRTELVTFKAMNGIVGERFLV